MHGWHHWFNYPYIYMIWWLFREITGSTRNVSGYNDVIMSVMTSQITSVSIVCLTVCSGGNQRKYKGSASLAFVRGIHRSPVDSPHKAPVTRKKFRLMTSSWNFGFVLSKWVTSLHQVINMIWIRWIGYTSPRPINDFIKSRYLICNGYELQN